MVGLALRHQVFLFVKSSPQLVSLIQIPLVFRRTFVDVSGKHTEVSVNDACPGHKGKDQAVVPAGKNHGDKPGDNRKFSQRIHTVTAVHKSDKFFFHVYQPPKYMFHHTLYRGKVNKLPIKNI